MAKLALDIRQFHRLLSPGPVTLLTSQYRGQPNIMAVAWAMPLSLDPALVAVAIHPSRLTHEFVSKTEMFALNVPNLELITATHRCGLLSGRDADKFAALGLMPEPATIIDPPLIAACVGHLECAVVERVRSGDHDLFIGQVLATAVEEEAFDGVWKAAEDAGKLLHHLGADQYATLARGYQVGPIPERR